MTQKTNTPRIGIIGGMGNEAMVDVLKKLNRYCSPSTPFIAFGNSRLAYKPEELTQSWQSEDPPEKRKRDTTNYTLRFIQYLGVDSLGLTCNSAHALFREQLKEIPLPFIDMLQHTAMTVENTDKPILIIGVDSIVQSGLYQSALNDVGVSSTKPSPDNQTKVMQAIYDPSFGIKTAKITKEAEKLLCDVINDEYQKFQTQKIVLGCTELPLALTTKSILRFKQNKKLPPCIEVIDASEILAQALVSQLPSTTQHRVALNHALSFYRKTNTDWFPPLIFKVKTMDEAIKIQGRIFDMCVDYLKIKGRTITGSYEHLPTLFYSESQIDIDEKLQHLKLISHATSSPDIDSIISQSVEQFYA